MQDQDWTTPEDIRDLHRPEHLLVLALRATAMGCGDCPAIRQGFLTACGAEGEQARMAFFLLVRQIGVTGRRRLRLHVPGCVCLSADERAIVAVVAAAQDALHTGSEDRLRAHLRWLVEQEPSPGFLEAARCVAGVLQNHGHRLPLRLTRPAPIAPTLH